MVKPEALTTETETVAQRGAGWLLCTALPINANVVFPPLPHSTAPLKKSCILILNSPHDRVKQNQKTLEGNPGVHGFPFS